MRAKERRSAWRAAAGLLIAWGLPAAVIALALIGFASYQGLQRQLEEARWVEHTHAVLTTLEETVSLLKDAETGTRGYVITGEERYLDPYTRALDAIRGEFTLLRQQLADNPGQVQHAYLLESLAASRLNELEAVLEAYRESAAKGAAQVRTGRGKSYMDEIRMLGAQMKQEQERLLAQRAARASASADATLRLIMFGTVAGLVVVLFAFFALRRENARRVEAQRMAQQRADEIEDLYNHAPCGYHSLDKDGVMVRVNDTELAWLGYARAEIVGSKKFSELLTPESAARFEETFPRFRETGRIDDVEYDLVRRDGTVFSVSLYATTMYGENGEYLMSRATLFDITERKRNERRMHFLQTAMLETSEAEDTAAALTVVLRRICEFTGWTYGQAWLPNADGQSLGLSEAWYSKVPELRQFWERNKTLSITANNILVGGVWKSQQPAWAWDLDPDPKYARRAMILEAGFKSWLGFPVISEGVVIAVIEFLDIDYGVRDDQTLQLISILSAQLGPVIQRKLAVEEIRRLHGDLEQRAAQLESANRELESFSYSVSHDLRSPLRAIDGFSQMLQEDYAARLDDEGRRLLDVIRDNSRKMGRLIDDLLDFSRLGRKPLSAAQVDMTTLAAEVLQNLEQAQGPLQPRVTLNPMPAAWCDPVLIRQAWVNLLSNAIKFSSRREAPVVEVNGHLNGGDAVYCVKDNGAGFDMQYYDKLFGVFQRLHSADEFPGTGVGLAIVQRVVSRHGGRVWAEGEPGKGATFYFSLPTGTHDG